MYLLWRYEKTFTYKKVSHWHTYPTYCFHIFDWREQRITGIRLVLSQRTCQTAIFYSSRSHNFQRHSNIRELDCILWSYSCIVLNSARCCWRSQPMRGRSIYTSLVFICDFKADSRNFESQKRLTNILVSLWIMLSPCLALQKSKKLSTCAGRYYCRCRNAIHGAMG